jgi:hypothetical protein
MGFAKAAAAILQGIAPRVQDTYTNAANADAGYARGLGDQTQGAINQQAASDNAFLQKMGTPSGGLVHPADVGGTAYGLEGYIPASTLQREGAGFGAAAQMLPGDALAQGRQQASASLNDTTNIAKLQAELAKLAATQPEVYQKVLSTLEGFAFRQAELAQSQQRIGISRQSLDLSRQSLALRGQYEQQSLNLRAQSQAQTARNENRSHDLALKRLGLESKRLRMSASRSEKKAKSGGFTPDELVHIRAQAGSIAYEARHGGRLSDGSPDKSLPPLNYKQAMKQEILHGIPPSIAAKALIDAGYSDKNLYRGVDGLAEYAQPGRDCLEDRLATTRATGGIASARRPPRGAGS